MNYQKYSAIYRISLIASVSNHLNCQNYFLVPRINLGSQHFIILAENRYVTSAIYLQFSWWLWLLLPIPTFAFLC